MSKPVELKPGDPNPRSFPWGDNTPTYKIWLTLITLNILFITAVFVIDVEIPLLQESLTADDKTIIGGVEKGNSTTGTASTGTGLESNAEVAVAASPVVDWLSQYGMWVIVGNVVTVWVLKTVGKWLSVVERWCRDLCKCKWYKPWCCIGQLFCWFVTVLKWVTWVVAVATSVLTSVLVWVTQNADKVQG